VNVEFIRWRHFFP